MRGLFTFLGTGASSGVPMVGCDCSICVSASSFNQRLRPAGWLRIGTSSLLIDVGPDFRQQALKYGIMRVDGLLLTHTHFDHIAGIDDLRAYSLRQKAPVPCLLSKESFEDIKTRYFYFFRPSKNLTAQLSYQVLESDEGVVSFVDLQVQYFSYRQGDMKVTGYRIGNFAYVSDIRDYDDSIFDHLQGIDQLVLSALRFESSHLHLSLDQAIAFARKTGARSTRLTHLSHFLDHEETNRSLPPDIQLGYDGLNIEFEV
jgi:phosphoribosyl 1,2-cyclic phosphate phosphodiesterase